MMVSARDGDGSVREAMQNLVRHVLENKYSMKKYRNKGDSKKHKEKRKKEIEGLDKTGIKSVRFFMFSCMHWYLYIFKSLVVHDFNLMFKNFFLS